MEMVDTSDLRSPWNRMSEPRCQARESSTGDHYRAEVVKARARRRTMGDKQNVRVRRAYDEPERDGGTRVLVDRIWPRGLTKDKACLDQWFKQVAPRQSYGNGTATTPNGSKSSAAVIARNSSTPSAPKRSRTCGSWPGAGR